MGSLFSSTISFLKSSLFFWMVVGIQSGVSAQALSGIQPKYGEFVEESTVSFSWNSMPGAIDYTVLLATDAQFSTNLIQSTAQVTTSWSSPVLSFGVWYWKVIGNNGFQTYESEVNSFRHFDPTEISGLSMWLSAGQGVVLNTGNVEQWHDQSANAHQFQQGSSSEMPVWLTNDPEIDNQPSLVFDGISDFMDGGNIQNVGTNNVTHFIVSKGSGVHYAKYGSPSSPYNLYSLYNIGSNVFEFAGINFQSLTGGLATGYNISTLRADRTLSSMVFFRNGNVLSSSSISTPQLHNFSNGNSLLLGRYQMSGTPYYLDGKIAELIFFNEALSDSLKGLVEEYLDWKYTPDLDLGEDIYVSDRYCDTSLTATAGYNNILWSTGATTNSISVNEGTYWVEGTDLFGFVHRDTIEVHYPVIPGPLTTGICAGGNVVWDADLGVGFTYLWSTSETTPNISISIAGNYSVEVFDGYGCSRMSNTETFTIDNYATTATLGNDTSLCVGNDLYLQVGAPETVSYLWPDASAGPLYGVDTTGVYWVTTTNVNGCVAQDTVNITILGTAPDALFNTPNDCLGQTTLFTDASTPQGGDPITSWDWDFGDTNTDNVQNSSNVYASNGMYIVTLDILAQSGCGDRFIDTIFVYTPPTANYTFAGHCAADSVYFTDGSTAGEGALSVWSWNFGQPASGENTSVLSNPAHLFDEVNSFDVELIVTDINGCEDTLTQTVNIDPSPESLFTVVDSCLDAPLDVTNNATIGAPGFIVSYNWDFGDGTTSTSSNPNKSYTTYGTYDVQLVTTSNLTCTDTVVQSVTIHALPVPNFSFSNECVGLTTVFNDVSTVADGSIDSTRWIYDVFDTLYGNPSSFVFNTEGDHFVKLTTISEWGCQKDTIKVVPVGPALNASFTTLNAGSIVVGSPVQFNNTSNGGDSYWWDLGDLTTTTDTDPSHSYSETLLDSTITVQLIANNTFGCSDTVSQSYVISRAMLDLEVQKLFLLEQNGYFDVAVQLHNKGTARVEGADLELTLQNGTVMLEYYPDTLYAGQTQIYVLNSHPSAVFSDQDNQEGYACLKTTPYTTPMLPEEDWTNNERCQNVEGTNPILIGPNPNPTNGVVELGVLLTEEANVDLVLYDDRGRLVHMIHDNELLSKGYHLTVLDLSVYGNGVYILRLVSDDFVTTKKVIKK